MIALTLRPLLRGIAPSLIALKLRQTLPGGPAAGLVVAHLSDLHLCAGTTMEGGLPADAVVRAARAALDWCFEQRPDLVVLSGDITDAGREEEWQLLHGLLGGLPPARADRLLIVPGNHDLTITLEAYSETDGRLVLAHEARCRSFARHVLGRVPRDAAFHGDRSGSLREMLERCEDYALAYDRLPPRLGTQREQWRGLGAQLRQLMRRGDRARSRRPRDLTEYVPPVMVPDALVTEAARDRGTPWPTADRPLYQDLLALIYPMTLYESPSHVVIGLNSNTIPAVSIVDGAIGMLGRGQLDRLEALLRSRSGKCAILVVHHHLGCPPEILARLQASPLELKVLQLADTARLRRILAGHASVVVLHGHKHVGYWADLDRIHVISAPSVAYGNRVGTDNCHVYAIGTDGRVSLVASTRVSARPGTG